MLSRFSIVFDREGYSPAFFLEMKEIPVKGGIFDFHLRKLVFGVGEKDIGDFAAMDRCFQVTIAATTKLAPFVQ